MTTPAEPLAFGFLLFPNLTQLDPTGPFEVFASVAGAEVHLIWKTLDPVASNRGLTILPTATFETCPRLDLICVPGGPGQIDLMGDDETLDFLRRTAASYRLVTSVCTGSLALGAAGLLRGYRATSHWASLDHGIDFALVVVAEVLGAEFAKGIQLQIEYDPEPPFDSGSPRRAAPELVAAARAKIATFLERRTAATERAAARL